MTVTAEEISGALIRDVLEQVMRATDDLLDVLTVDQARRGAVSVHATVGRLLDRGVGPFEPGFPLYAWATGAPVDPSWRSRCEPAPQSLWAALELYRIVAGRPDDVFADPFEEWKELSNRVDL